MNLLIVGASGNLGSHLSKQLLQSSHRLNLLTHERGFPFDLPEGANAEIVQGDLNDRASLQKVCKNIDCIVYLAGVLFRPRPESFLHRTNTVFVQNIVDAALSQGVRKFVLVSFPHVEEGTTPSAPAKGILDVHPKSITLAPGSKRRNISSVPAKIKSCGRWCFAPESFTAEA